MDRSAAIGSLRLSLLLAIALSLVMMGTRIVLDPEFLGMPGGSASVVGPAALLIADAFLVMFVTRGLGPVGQAVLWEGFRLGIAAGVLEVAHILVETFGRLAPRAEAWSTVAFMLGLLLAWGAAGYRAARVTGQAGPGLLAGSWCALVGMVITVTFGFSQLFWSLPQLEQRNVGSPDLVRSGWTDLHAFTIADLFWAGFKVLLVGPVAGAALGGLGGALALLVGKIKGRRSV